MSDVPEGYKMSEVGVIPKEWEVLNVSDFTIDEKGSIKIGPFGSQLKKETLVNQGYKVYGQENIYKKNMELGDRFISTEHFNKLKSCELHSGDFVISMMGTIGKCMVVPNNIQKGIMDSHLLRLQLEKDKVNPIYLSQLFISSIIFNQIKQLSVGGIMDGLSSSIIQQINFSLPPLPEQQAISSALNDVDALITALEQLITKKRNIKQGAMQQLLTGKKRLPGFSGEWEVKKLGDIAEIQRGASPRPIESPIWYDTKSKVGWVRISDVTTSNGKNLSQTKDYLSEKGISQSRFLPKNSLIMSICATVGIPVITSFETCIHDGFIGFSKLNNIDKEFLYYKLKEFENSFKSMGQTGSQSNLNSDLVRNCAIIIPPHPEQQAIAQILTDMDTEIESLKQKRNKYKAIKQGMMQELLTGKTRLL